MVQSKQSAYEAQRQKTLEENQKRMEGLKKLSQNLRPVKASPMKKVKPKAPKQPVDPSSIRRSGRNADKPPVSYRDEPIVPLGRRPRINSGYGTGRRDIGVYASHEEREYAKRRAEDLQRGLDPDVPSFVKLMLHSHVIRGFWLGLPVEFCKTHLPKRDVTVNLVDENGGVTDSKYLAGKTGLSGGWRGFAINHDIVPGDALVFQLMDPTTFKIYIIRAKEPGESES